MNATANAIGFANAGDPRPVTTAERMIINVGGIACEIRVRAILPIDELLGYEDQLEVPGDAVGAAAEAGAAAARTVADLLDSRMIAPPRPRRRRQRPVSSRALFYGRGG